MELKNIIYFLGLLYYVYCDQYLLPDSLPDENNFEYLLYENNYELLKKLNTTLNTHITIPKIMKIKLKHLNYSESLNLKSDQCFISNDDFLEKLNITNISELNNTMFDLIKNQTSCIKKYPLYKNLSCSYLDFFSSDKILISRKYSKYFFECDHNGVNSMYNDLFCEEDELYSKEFTRCIEHEKITNKSINEKEIFFRLKFPNKPDMKEIQIYKKILQIHELFYSCSEFLLDLQSADCFRTGSWNFIDNCQKKDLFDVFHKDITKCFNESLTEMGACIALNRNFVESKLSRFKRLLNNMWYYILQESNYIPTGILYTEVEMEYCNNKIKNIKNKIYNGKYLVTNEALNIFKTVNINRSFFNNNCNYIENYFNKRIKDGQFRKNKYTCEELIVKIYINGKSIEYSKNIDYYKKFPYVY